MIPTHILFMSLKLHFSDDKYDSIKYNYKLKSDIKNHYKNFTDVLERIYRKDEERIKNYFISSFIEKNSEINSLFWFKNNANLARYNLRKYEKYFSDVNQNFNKDLHLLSSSDIFSEKFLPNILTGNVNSNIIIYTLIIIWNILNLDEHYKSFKNKNPLFDDKSMLYKKSSRLMKYDKEECLKIFNNWRKDNVF